MGQLNGYAIVPNGTYDQFRSFCLSTGVNVDYAWGNQCMDTVMLLYYQYGFWLRAGPYGYAYETFTNYRWANSVGPFQSYTGANNIKRGDVLVFAAHGAYYTGHIAFADEDYHGGGTIRIMGQNQGQGIGWGASSNIIDYNIGLFIGGFRNVNWDHAPTPPPTPPTPGGGSRDNKYPWAVFTRKIRSR